ncbi:MAG: dihydrofolate reductase [Bacteroidetes bacterium]|nr:dihydrofolate reductase [Bacteroidota bacterium]
MNTELIGPNKSLSKIIIAAVSKNNVIGNRGSIPWTVKEELRHFKNTTYGFPVIMGRTTYESIGMLLEGRLNIVLSKKLPLHLSENFIVTDNIENAFNTCNKRNLEKVFIIGGEKVYKETLPLADKLIISRINIETIGDTYFPDYNVDEWELITIEKKIDFDIETYLRKQS